MTEITSAIGDLTDLFTDVFVPLAVLVAAFFVGRSWLKRAK